MTTLPPAYDTLNTARPPSYAPPRQAMSIPRSPPIDDYVPSLAGSQETTSGALVCLRVTLSHCQGAWVALRTPASRPSSP